MFEKLSRIAIVSLASMVIGVFPPSAFGQQNGPLTGDQMGDFSPSRNPSTTPRKPSEPQNNADPDSFGNQSRSGGNTSGLRRPADWHENDWIKFIDTAVATVLGETLTKVGGRLPLVDVYSALSAVGGSTKTGVQLWLRKKIANAYAEGDYDRGDRYNAFYSCLTWGDCTDLQALQQQHIAATNNTSGQQRYSQYYSDQAYRAQQWITYYDTLIYQWINYRDQQLKPYYNHPTYYQWARNEYYRSNQQIQTLLQYKAYYQNILQRSK